MAASEPEHGYIEEVESLNDYRPGGYHPIQIDHRLHERYRIVHKLGHGTFSTVWLAIDERTSNYVAVKGGTADADTKEVEILSRLTTGVSDRSQAAPEASMMIPTVMGRFSLDGPNGTHPCLVTAPARCSLIAAKEASDSRLFQLDVAWSLAAQLAMAVSFVHSQGYAHGDLHLGNLLLQLPHSFNDLSIDQLYSKIGAPKLKPVIRLDKPSASPAAGVPSHAVPPVWLGIASDKITLKEAKLLLTDFGVAFRPSDKSRFDSYTPLVIRAPEAFCEPTTPLSFASDIWSLACIIFELFAHRSLIDGTFFAPQDEITAQQIHLQGLLPSDWWHNWEQRAKWFDEAGGSLENERDIWRWDRRFGQWVQEPRQHFGMTVVDEEEKAALLEMLQCMLAWRPSDRPDAAAVLNMTWMKKWALPAYEGSRKDCV
ncbi:kinase-like protein [Colletotrichum zoysiae]|uniref:Kinase-like protein n=1 Tax=Colletotrichum zoysiae TaxID=1216348 RepID=A0AAD9HSM5_9PEZI|nr:kinase-like protein [Colletotrichum zoysiae]